MTGLDNLLGTTLAGCRIISKIGQGGMGTVYTAHHIALDKTVCVKILSPDLARDGRNIEFFMREARSAATLEHPNIVRIYSFGQEAGLHYIIMSYIEGRSLAEVVAKNGPMDTNAATGIMIEVLDALRHAHSKAIVHRDIKPSNILLGSNGHSSIVDFGLARSISEEKLLTIAGEIIGTAYFMSPEQGLAGQVDHRADLYSVGATFFYLLTGKYPFDGKTYIEVVHKHIGEPLPNIIVLKPDIPLWVSHVLDHLMRKNPKDRYQSATQAIDEIKRLRTAEESGESVSTERSIELPGLSERLAGERASPAAPGAKKAAAISTPASLAAKALKNARRLFPALRKIIKMALYCAVTFTAMCCFLLAGSAGTKESEILPSLRFMFSATPAGAPLLFAAGLGLVILAVFFRPLRSAVTRFFLLAAACLTAYACAVYLPYPYNPDMASKAFFCLRVAVENVFSPFNLLLCSLFLFVMASKLFFKQHWTAKAASAVAYLLSLLFICLYFKGEVPVSPKESYLALAALAALAGTASALTQKRFILFFNAPLLFFAANALTFAMFTAPDITAITEKNQRAQKLASESRHKPQRAMMSQENMPTEFDSSGQPVVRQPADSPRKTRQATRGELHLAASLEYYKMFVSRLKQNLFSSAGLIYLSLLLLLMANLLFAEAVMKHYEAL
jgi:predicted Ser/Thr protein kinase